MRKIVVVSRAADWPLDAAGVEVVLGRDYLVDPALAREANLRVYNLCRSYRYQSEGYYVSLLAAAREHRPFPSLMTVLDMKSRAVVRIVDESLEELVQKSLAQVRGSRFELSIYFGRNLVKRNDRLAVKLFSQFPAPLLRASFIRSKRWKLSTVTPIGFRDVPEDHWSFVREAALAYFARPRGADAERRTASYELAILTNPAEALAPSDEKALVRFRQAAEKVGFAVQMIQREDYGRLCEFDALFIRETTFVNHHTFRFAQRAESEGLIVIDDPTSILRCTNKVFQAEAFAHAGIPTPKTWVTDSVTPEEVLERVGFPCVLKVPDSAFSQGVVKCNDAVDLEREAAKILACSDLLIVQEFTPSDFDWRVGVLGGEVLYACRYHMARGHWQIIQTTGSGKFRYGKVETVSLSEVPPTILETAKQATATIGLGLYGVDLKQIGTNALVMEVNDNPNIDSGAEDQILKDELYLTIMRELFRRVEGSKRRSVS